MELTSRIVRRRKRRRSARGESRCPHMTANCRHISVVILAECPVAQNHGRGPSRLPPRSRNGLGSRPSTKLPEPESSSITRDQRRWRCDRGVPGRGDSAQHREGSRSETGPQTAPTGRRKSRAVVSFREAVHAANPQRGREAVLWGLRSPPGRDARGMRRTASRYLLVRPRSFQRRRKQWGRKLDQLVMKERHSAFERHRNDHRSTFAGCRRRGGGQSS